MKYGKTVGLRFEKSGAARVFRGNTVVAHVLEASEACRALSVVRRRLEEEGFGENLIFLPEGSYHVTFLQGINDQNRTPDRWPVLLSPDASMEEADAYFTAAVLRAGLPGSVHFRFDSVAVSESCVIVRLLPDSEEDEKILRDFRDRAAKELNHFIPGHDTYRFHITLAYVRTVPEGERWDLLNNLAKKMTMRLAAEPPFETSSPYLSYFHDMLSFPKKREK